MADDNNFQNRLSNTPNRGTAPAGQGTDPLAELARLIGQNDPYADFGRAAVAPAPAQPRPVPNEQSFAAQSDPEQPQQSAAAGAYRVVQEVPVFPQAPSGVGDYRESAYRDFNQIPPSNEFYDEPEQGGRSRRVKTAMTVIALAVVGIVGAFGYRMMFSGPDSGAPPPVIRSNPEPTKVPPPTTTANNETSQGKFTDRLGDRGQDSRLVSREEAPVAATDLNRPNSGRNQPPPSSTGSWSQAVPPNLPPTSQASSVSASAPPSTLGEPRRVRTVPIRPESNDANMVPPSLTPPTASAPASASNARSTSAQNQPAFVSNQARPPVTAVQPLQASGNTPLSLGDDTSPTMPRTTTQAPPPAPRQAPQRQAAPPQPLAAPQRQAAAPIQREAPPTTSIGGGGYLVQVSSQRSEADAQAALRNVQSKYASVLSGQKATIRRADLGERGVFYRAMIGPFASRDQATQLCGSLKAAGGDCIVQGN